jgi:hypothetical protein
MRAVAVAIALVVLGVVSASAPPVAPAARTASCAGAISWSQAKAHIGRVKTVRGRVAGAFYASSSNGSPTFFNLGADYPSSRRFTVVIWGRDRHRFGAPERRYARRTICVRGLIRSYDGVAEVFATSPSKVAAA